MRISELHVEPAISSSRAFWVSVPKDWSVTVWHEKDTDYVLLSTVWCHDDDMLPYNFIMLLDVK